VPERELAEAAASLRQVTGDCSSSSGSEISIDREEIDGARENAIEEEERADGESFGGLNTSDPGHVSSVAAVSHTAHISTGYLDAAMAELDMDKYDNEDSIDSANATRLFGGGQANYYLTNDEDPYMTVKDDMDEEEDDYPDDYTMLPTDRILLAARTEDNVSHLEVYVYEEPLSSDIDDSNLYCHHDLLLPAFPLCLSWLSCPTDGAEQVHTNCVAIGTMYPGIEIWDLDLIDAIEPLASLGGYEHYRNEEKNMDNTVSRKRTANPTKNHDRAGPASRDDSHTDAVLDLSWNAYDRSVLASASADQTVRVWDITTQKTKNVLYHHSGKVQAVAWNPVEAEVLLTGGFDNCAAVIDIRAPEKAAMSWEVKGDVECVLWNLDDPTQFLVSNDAGFVLCMDTRKGGGSECIFSLRAHERATTSLSISAGAPSLLLTCSTDKFLKLWDISDGKPSLVAKNNPDVGALFTAGFAPSVPYLVGCAGSNGAVAVWDIRAEAAVAEGQYSDQLEQFSRAAALKLDKASPG